jgi:hypothetical protein
MARIIAPGRRADAAGPLYDARSAQEVGGGPVLANVLTRAVLRLDGALVEDEGTIAPGGLPGFLAVGRPDHAVREAREPVRAAIRNCRFVIPTRRMTAKERLITLSYGIEDDSQVRITEQGLEELVHLGRATCR